MSILMETDTHLWIDEVILFVDVEALVDIAIVGGNELFIDTISSIIHMAILHIRKDVPLVGEMVNGLGEDVAIELVGIAVVVLVIAVLQVLAAHFAIGNISDVAEMVRPEVLK